MINKSYAAIDLGSNSCRLLICDDNGCQLYAQNYSTRLAEGLQDKGRLTVQAFARGREAFAVIRQKLDEYKVDSQRMRAVTTAACRMAENGAEFISEIEKCSGIKLEIIDAKEEAELNLQGAAAHIKGKTKYVLVWDIGGGSTEVTLAYNMERPQIIKTISIPYGARNASEKFGLCEYDENKAEELRKCVKGYMNEFLSSLDLPKTEEISFVATSSTALRMAALLEKKEKYVREDEDGHIIEKARVSDMVDSLYKTTVEEMAKNDCIGELRAPIFIAAVVIFVEIMQKLQADKIVASLKSAKDAIVAELIERDKNNGKIN